MMATKTLRERARPMPWTWREGSVTSAYAVVLGIPNGAGGFTRLGWFMVERPTQKTAGGVAHETVDAAKDRCLIPLAAKVLCVRCLSDDAEPRGLHLRHLTEDARGR